MKAGKLGTGKNRAGACTLSVTVSCLSQEQKIGYGSVCESDEIIT